MGMDKENYNESVKLTWLTCLFKEGFSQPMCKASLIFSWKDVEAVSRIEKQSSEHKDLHASDPLMCWKYSNTHLTFQGQAVNAINNPYTLSTTTPSTEN